MLELLKQFAALALMSGIVTSLLPEGTMKRTASMVIGLLMLLCWAEGLAGLLAIPSIASLPDTLLAPTDAGLVQSAENARNTILSQWEAAR